MATWTWTNSDLTGATAKCFAGDTNGNIIAGTSSGIYYSSKTAPSRWYQSNITSGNIVAVASTADGSAMFAVTSTLIYYSTDYGHTMNVIASTPLGPYNSICCNGSWATAGYVNIVFSIDSSGSGTTYQTRVKLTNIANITWILADSFSGKNCVGIACDPSGNNYMLIVSNDYIYNGTGAKVDNNTAIIWTQVAFSNKPWTSIACSGDGSKFIACESGGAIWTYTSLQFEQINTGVPSKVYNYVAISHTGTNLYATSYNDGFAYSTNSGSTWNSDTSKTSLYAIYINPTGVSNAGLPLLLGANNTTGRGIYYADYTPAICFKEGTKILCLVDGVETYIPIETMTTDTLVKTSLDGYKKVELIGFSKLYNPGHSLKSLNRLYKCTPAKYPELTEDLIITGHHAILEKTITDKQRADLIDAMGNIYVTDRKYRLLACVDDRAEPYTEEGVHTIWHFALENPEHTWNYGVYAHGLLVESCSIRTMRDLSGMTLLK